MEPPAGIDQHGTNTANTEADTSGNIVFHLPPPTPPHSDMSTGGNSVGSAPFAVVDHSTSGRHFRCVPTDACEAFTAAIVIVLVILFTAIVILFTNNGPVSHTFAYSTISAILGMALAKLTKAKTKAKRKGKDPSGSTVRHV